jgi:chromosomal replication initiator protein
MQSGIEGEARAGLPFSTAIEGNGMTTVGSRDEQVAFERVKAKLKARLGSEVYSSWFGRMKLADSSKGIARLSVPTAFLRSWINGHYLELISELWKAEEPNILKIEVVVRSATRNCRPSPELDLPTPRKSQRPMQTALGSGTINGARVERGLQPHAPGHPDARQSVLGSPLDTRYTFQSFIEGPSNRVAFAAAKAVAESASNAVRFNPLFLHAAVGLGKTHLLQAIAAESLKRHAQARVVYLTAEYFMWRFATAIRDNNALTLKEQLRDIDLLIIDDM